VTFSSLLDPRVSRDTHDLPFELARERGNSLESVRKVGFRTDCFFRSKDFGPRARKRRLKAAFRHENIVQYVSALGGGEALEMQRQNVPLQRIDLQLQPGNGCFR
jgi:hypothetical protein